MEALGTNTALLTLTMRFHELGPVAVAGMATMLKVNTSLRCLMLDVDLGPGLQAIAGALGENTSLRSLTLGDRELDAEAVGALTEALTANVTLQALTLTADVCPAATPNGRPLEARAQVRAMHIAGMLGANRSLRSLALAGRPSGAALAAIAEALHENTTLRHLAFEGVATEGIAAALARNRALPRLWLVLRWLARDSRCPGVRRAAGVLGEDTFQRIIFAFFIPGEWACPRGPSACGLSQRRWQP